MADVPKILAQAQLGTSDAAVFTGTAAHTYVLAEVVVCNTDSVSRTGRIHFVPAAGSSSAANAVVYDQIMPANATVRFGRGWVVEGAGMIRGLADAANKLTVTIFGIDSY